MIIKLFIGLYVINDISISNEFILANVDELSS